MKVINTFIDYAKRSHQQNNMELSPYYGVDTASPNLDVNDDDMPSEAGGDIDDEADMPAK